MHKLIATIVLSSSVILYGVGMAQDDVPTPTARLVPLVNHVIPLQQAADDD